MGTALTEALKTVRKARDRVEAARDVLPTVARELEDNSMQRLFEAAFPEQVGAMTKAARSAVFFAARDGGGPPMSTFNEYVQYMGLVELIVGQPRVAYERPPNQHSTEVLEANNPLGTAFHILRSNPGLSDSVFASVLEAAYPLAVAGLGEEARNLLFQLAKERGVSAVDIAMAYGELVDMVAEVRFVEDEDEDGPEGEEISPEEG